VVKNQNIGNEKLHLFEFAVAESIKFNQLMELWS